MKISELFESYASNEELERAISVLTRIIGKTWKKPDYCLVNNNPKTQLITFQLFTGGDRVAPVDISSMYKGNDPQVIARIRDKLGDTAAEERMRYQPTIDAVIDAAEGILGYKLISDIHRVNQTVSALKPIEEFKDDPITSSTQEVRLVLDATLFKLK